MPIPCRAPATMATAVVLLLLQTGCTGTQFGDGLSRSFPSPGSADQPAPQQGPAGPASQANPAPTMTGPLPTPVGLTPPGGQPPVSGPAAPAQQSSPVSGATKTAAGSPPATGTPAMAPGASQVRKSAPAANPLPYRVTIRLPEADPSAPAEAVTKALRATGVAFEVETIERITTPGSALPATAAPSPAPAAQSAAPAPTTRPAPPPR